MYECKHWSNPFTHKTGIKISLYLPFFDDETEEIEKIRVFDNVP